MQPGHGWGAGRSVTVRRFHPFRFGHLFVSDHDLQTSQAAACKRNSTFTASNGNQCCPNPGFHSVGRRADKRFDLQVLFERLEEQFDLPVILVNSRDGRSAKTVVIAWEYQRFPGVFADGLDAAQEVWAFFLRTRTGQADGLVFKNIPVLWRVAFFDPLILRVVLHARDKKNTGPRPICEQSVVVVASVIHHDGAGREGNFPSRFTAPCCGALPWFL